MTYIAIGAVLSAVGLAVRMIFMNGANNRMKKEIEALTKTLDELSAGLLDCQTRSSARIAELKGKNDTLMQEILSISGPGDRIGILNRMLQKDPSPDDSGH